VKDTSKRVGAEARPGYSSKNIFKRERRQARVGNHKKNSYRSCATSKRVRGRTSCRTARKQKELFFQILAEEDSLIWQMGASRYDSHSLGVPSRI